MPRPSFVLATKVMAFAQENGMFGNRKESSELVTRVLDEFLDFIAAYFGYEPNADNMGRI